MFYEGIAATNKEKLLKSIPKFEKDRLFYFRHEKNGKISFAISNGKTQEMLMNDSAWEILRLCNGIRTVDKIREIYEERYSHYSQSVDFLRDVASTLFVFDKLWALSWGKGGTPFMVQEKVDLNENYKLVWAVENDIRDIVAVYRKSAKEKSVCHNGATNCANGLSDYQNETIVRGKLFYYKEDFFLLKDLQDAVVGVVSVKNNQPDTDILEIATVFVPDSFLDTVLKGVKELLEKSYPLKISKIRMKILAAQVEDSLHKKLEACGFSNVATFQNEYGDGNNLYVYDCMR